MSATKESALAMVDSVLDEHNRLIGHVDKVMDLAYKARLGFPGCSELDLIIIECNAALGIIPEEAKL